MAAAGVTRPGSHEPVTRLGAWRTGRLGYPNPWLKSKEMSMNEHQLGAGVCLSGAGGEGEEPGPHTATGTSPTHSLSPGGGTRFLAIVYWLRLFQPGF